jgi:hypothetical protein
VTSLDQVSRCAQGDRPLHDSYGMTEKKHDTRKLTLHPLSFEEALEAALQVEPPPKPEKKGRVKKEKPSAKDGFKK